MMMTNPVGNVTMSVEGEARIAYYTDVMKWTPVEEVPEVPAAAGYRRQGGKQQNEQVEP